MTDTQIRWIQEARPASTSASDSGQMLQLCGRQIEAALAAAELSGFLSRLLPELTAELAVQWTALIRREPGPEWKTVAEYGRSPVSERPIRLWEECLDRECSGTLPCDGGTAFAFFLEAGPTASLLVGSARQLDPDFPNTGLITAKAVSLALQVAADRSASRQKLDRIRSTLDISCRLSDTEEMAPLLELIAQEATRLLNCDRSSIFLWDKDRNEVEARPALGVPGASLRLPAGEGIVGQCLATGRPINVDDAYNDPRFNTEVDRKSGYRTRNLLCVPLRDPDDLIMGAFECINRNDGRAFSPDDVECLEQLGKQAAIALKNLREFSRLNRSRDQLAEQAAGRVQIIGESPAIIALRDTIERLSGTDLPVLILGESGTGKEVVAGALHFGGIRQTSPFVAVNCAALTESLLESELFGHEQGAFTDARDTRQGKFELADGGTLFLDEIGDMSLNGQAKLLRVLEQKVITRVGGSQPIPVNVRIVAATNAHLASAVREKKFREDLYYRLSVVTLELPPLRDRPEDILLLAEHFLQLFALQARRPGLSLTSEARRRLQAHQWPGNIRELRNLMERIAFLCPNDRIDADDLKFTLSPEEEEGSSIPLDLGLEKATRQFQRDYIRRSIHQVSNNMTDAAKLLGLHRSNLYRKMKQLNMSEVHGEE